MPIPRLQLFELEDQSWFPTVIRDVCTDYIHFIEITLRLHRPVVPPLAAALRTTQSEHVVDLCSGGGGPIPALQRALAAEGLDLRFTLTDRFPNLPAFHRLETTSHAKITYAAHSVDARAVPKDLKGIPHDLQLVSPFPANRCEGNPARRRRGWGTHWHL